MGLQGTVWWSVGLVFLLVAVRFATATTYYVGTSGSNSNNGRGTNTAWRTIQYAVDHVNAGDTILVLAGTYAGACFDSRRGTAGSPITLKANPGDHVLLNSLGTHDAQKYHKSILLFEGWDSGIPPRYWVVEGFEITGAPLDGIDIRGWSAGNPAHHITIRSNYIHHCTSRGIISIYAHDLIIEGNETAYHSNQHGIYCANAGDRPIIRNNISHNNPGCGIHLNADGEIIEDAIIEGNVVYQNGSNGGSAINCDGVLNGTIRNNLIFENLAHGISLFRIDGSIPSRNCRIYNNTVLLPSNRGSKGEGWGVNISSANAWSNKIYNNIIYNERSTEGSINVHSSSLMGFESDYNILDGKLSTDGYPVSTIKSLAQWQALGYGSNSFNSTPSALFEDAANDDYHLKQGSPAVDAGVSVPGVTNDYDGVYRPRGAGLDVGAFERIQYRINAAAGSNGWIHPSGDVYVDCEGSTSFVVGAHHHFHISSIKSNGVSLTGYTYDNDLTNTVSIWSNLVNNLELRADFSENIWFNETPERWIAVHYPTNRDFNELTMSDTDCDRLTAWEEYLVGTDPTNGNSRFRISGVEFMNGSNRVTWTAGTNGPPVEFQLNRCTNLMSGWSVIGSTPKGQSELYHAWDGSAPSGHVFYSIIATNAEG